MRFEPESLSPVMNRRDKIDLKPKALLSGDTMYSMHGNLLYVWQLHHMNYFKRFKIVFIIFNENLFSDFVSIFREYWLKSGDVLLENFQILAAILDFCQLGSFKKYICLLKRIFCTVKRFNSSKHIHRKLLTEH